MASSALSCRCSLPPPLAPARTAPQLRGALPAVESSAHVAEASQLLRDTKDQNIQKFQDQQRLRSRTQSTASSDLNSTQCSSWRPPRCLPPPDPAPALARRPSSSAARPSTSGLGTTTSRTSGREPTGWCGEWSRDTGALTRPRLARHVGVASCSSTCC